MFGLNVAFNIYGQFETFLLLVVLQKPNFYRYPTKENHLTDTRHDIPPSHIMPHKANPIVVLSVINVLKVKTNSKTTCFQVSDLTQPRNYPQLN